MNTLLTEETPIARSHWTIQDNNKIVDLGKCLHCELFYKNQHGQRIDRLYNFNTARGYRLVSDADISSAKKLGILDVWVPHIRLKMLGNSQLVFIGDKAKTIYKEWCARQFGNRTKQKKE